MRNVVFHAQFSQIIQILSDLFDARIIKKTQAKDILTTQAQAATEKATQDYTKGKQADQIEKRKSSDMSAFDAEVQSAMDAVKEEAKAKYQQLYDEEQKSLHEFYSLWARV